MRAGAQVIYQATFFDGTWRGHADFLHRIEEPSALGPWSYAVADTKLARKAKAGALLQMCVYSDLLAQVQGVEPPWMEVALGGSARAIERFRVADYMAYYRRARARFEALDGGHAAGVSGDRDLPRTGRSLRCLPLGRRMRPGTTGATTTCRWWPGITTRQRERLKTIDVRTVEALGELPIPVEPTHQGAERTGPGARPRAGAAAAGRQAPAPGPVRAARSRSSRAWPGAAARAVPRRPVLRYGG